MATVSITPDGSDPSSHPDVLVIPEGAPLDGPVGQLGAQYVLLREIAAGGMGKVYLARETGPAGYSRNVALKRIHDHLAGRSNFVTMFLDEARIASRIQHPHVCTVFDFGEVDGVYYIAMEYLRGQPLSEVLRELGRGSPDESPERYWLGAYLLAQACEGLHAAHELRDDAGKLLNVVHRDVSPHNLFVTWDGSTRVLDFGVARAADRLADSTTGRVKGKFAYMAPEQALGRHVDRRADVFSLGVVLWELLTLRRLFRKDNPGETVLALVQRPPPRPTMLVPGVPKALEDVAMKALSKRPAERYPNAREMGRALTRALAESGQPVSPAEMTEWMDRLFPGAREASHQLLESADEAMRSIPEPTPTHTRTKPSETPLIANEVPAAAPKSAARWVALAALMLLVAGVGAGVALTLVEPPVERQTLPSARLEPSPLTPAELPMTPEGSGSEGLDRVGATRADPELAFEADTDSERATAPTSEPERGEPPRGERPRADARARAAAAAARNRRRAVRPPPASTARGQVRFSGPSELWGARILHRGRRVGSVPGTVTLPAGSQRVDIVVDGRPRIQRTVEVPANGVERVVLR